MDNRYIDVFCAAYVECALWLALESDGDELRDVESALHVDDLPAGVMAAMRADCEAFTADNAADLAALDPAQCGHDFYLTRNGHGAGFWDRGLGDVGDRLTAACEPYGGQTIISYNEGETVELVDG